MHNYGKQMLEMLKSEIESIGVANLTTQQWEEAKLRSQIACNFVCFDKDYRIVEAMDEEDRYDEPYRYGYRGRDRQTGRFVHRSGRGRNAGYSPYYHMMEDGSYDDIYDMIPEMYDYRNYRMGYSGGNNSGNNNQGRSGNNYSDSATPSRYGRSYDEYRNARRNYTETNDPEHQKSMRDKISDVFEDMETITYDMIKDMSTEDKVKYRQKLQTMMQKIQ